MRNSALLYGRGFIMDRIIDARNLEKNLQLESLTTKL